MQMAITVKRELLKQKPELSIQSKIRLFSLPETIQINLILHPILRIIGILN